VLWQIEARSSELGAKVAELERKLTTHDRQISEIVKVIKELMALPQSKPKPIGFITGRKK